MKAAQTGAAARPGGEQVPLPEEVYQVLVEVVEAMRKAITLILRTQRLTTQEASSASSASGSPEPRHDGQVRLHHPRRADGVLPFEQIETISPRPLLLIAGSEADTLYFSQNAYEKAKEPKELHIIPGATHIDLYYKPEYVPQVAEKLTQFFTKNL